MDLFFQRLLVRAATIDELLSESFITLPGETTDANKAASRLASWCRSSAASDWRLFSKRLARDGLTFAHVLERFTTARRAASVPIPIWLSDAQWILEALQIAPCETSVQLTAGAGETQPFEQLLFGVVEAADKILQSGLEPTAPSLLSDSAYSSLRHSLLSQLADLCAPAFYEVSSRGSMQGVSGTMLHDYSGFLHHMRKGGIKELFEAKPVLLRLIASITRQWIDSNREFICRLATDRLEIRYQLCDSANACPAISIQDRISDPHNFGRSVLLVAFADGRRVLYKPKDLRVDSAWFEVVSWLNANGAPLSLRSPRVVVRDGYGWAEHIAYTECSGEAEFDNFFRRAGAWVALFHIFAGTDIHKENMIALADCPVPIDLEMLLQAEESEMEAQIPSLQALKLATRRISNSVAMTGLLPSFGRNLRNSLVDLGGLSQPSTESIGIYWENINQNGMRPVKRPKQPTKHLNLPSFAGKTAILADFIEPFLSGYEAYASYLCNEREKLLAQRLWDALREAPVRKILRPTRFYYLLLTRLKNPRNMSDGVEWSSHLDFCSRLMDWDHDDDPRWPLIRAERNALTELNIPHFIMRSDGISASDGRGITAQIATESGLERSRIRLQQMDLNEVGRQRDIIRIVTTPDRVAETREIAAPCELQQTEPILAPAAESLFLKSAQEIIGHISKQVIESGSSAAWIGLDWHGDSEKCRLVPLGYDLYSGAPGISLVLAAHAHVTGDKEAAELAMAGLSALRFNVRSVSAARFARVVGLGGALGMGSVVYALTVIGCLLGSEELLDDALTAAGLFTDDFIAMDAEYDAIGGGAGAILCLLALYKKTGDKTVLTRAVKCGEQLLKARPGDGATELWCKSGVSARPRTGMSHGAAGFAYAFGALHDATDNDAFLRVAHDCIRFENSFFDEAESNWPDRRQPDIGAGKWWPCQWCHGAAGIGLARIGLLRHRASDKIRLAADIRAAVRCVEMRWPDNLDTLCCGALGNIELLGEASVVLNRPELKSLAVQRLVSIVEAAKLAGDFRLGPRGRQFNLGLYKGIAGVGYTLLRQTNARIPNVLLWE